jgi:hypothetical protein
MATHPSRTRWIDSKLGSFREWGWGFGVAWSFEEFADLCRTGMQNVIKIIRRVTGPSIQFRRSQFRMFEK